MPTFTQDWFSHNVPGLRQVLSELRVKRRFLEIGCFEGLSACWFLQHGLEADGHLVCIDTFAGGEEHGGVDYSGVRARFEANVAEVRKPHQKVTLIEDTSHRALARMVAEDESFDFIYVDGSHTAPDVITDACLAYHLLIRGGIMVFDDYLWGPRKDLLHTPKIAVDLFTMLYHEKVEILLQTYQLAVRKTA